ncbi:MAG: helix-hairpin-helix domain-containing protein [Deltaproteobacteria bacterium]|nr:helix-hairpin-helix domain-containing protein [Deltaproteobacteria bacterium]
MNHKRKLKFIFGMIIMLITLAAGNAYAQHEGGLGEKRIHINIADRDQLMKIEGMTEEIADAIIEYREKSGFFKKPEDLLNVPGISKDVYKTLDLKVGTEGDLYFVPKEDAEEEFDEDEEPVLSPSKC